MRVLLAILAVAALVSSSQAEVMRWNDPRRFSAALGADHVFYQGGDHQDLARAYDSEWAVGLYAAWNLAAAPAGTRFGGLSLTGSALYALESEELVYKLGLRVRLH